MVAQVPTPPSRGASSSSATILMVDVLIGISTQVNNYDQMEGISNSKDTLSTSQLDSSLKFEKPTFKFPSHNFKMTLRRDTHNFNT